MESLFFLVPVALIFIVIAVRFLFWAVNSGQYDDLDTEAHRILFDDDSAAGENREKTEATKSDADAASDSKASEEK